MRPPPGIDTLKGAMRIDVGLTFIERTAKEKGRCGQKSSDLMEWIELSPAVGVKEGDKTKP